MTGGRITTRIAHVLTSVEMGGAEQLVLRLVTGLPTTRFDVRVICLRRAGHLADAFSEAGIELEVLPQGESGGAWLLARRLARSLRARPADILHTHNTSPFLVGSVASAMTHTPRHIHTKHGVGGPHSLAGRLLMRWAAGRVDSVIAVSGETREAAIHDDGFPQNVVDVVHNGVQVDAAPPRTPSDTPNAIMVARLEPVKGHQFLIDAVPAVLDAVPGFRLEIVGDGSLRDSLRQQVAALGVDHAVRFSGTQHDVSERLAHATLFVLPSLSEGVSLTLLEAMAASLPIVTTRVGGTPEVVRDGMEALLVPPSDAAALSSAIIRLASDPALARRLADSARARAESDFSLAAMTQAYVSRYDRLAASITP